MNTELLERLQNAHQELEPRFKALRSATGALKKAYQLASNEQPDALVMQKHLKKLEQAVEPVDSDPVRAAVSAFAAETTRALDGLAFDFARELKAAFEQRGQTVQGRPPTLVVDSLVLHIDIGARKAQWYYGKEALTRPIALSINTILKAYDQQRKAIGERTLEVAPFLREIYQAWQKRLNERSRRPSGGRINVMEIYSQVVMDRQSARFWNAPSRSTFKDYERAHFVRDLVLAQSAPTVEIDGTRYGLRLGGATKSQADNPNRSLWLPSSPLDGDYYSELTFEEV
jgi:hypothetical protein